MSERDPTEGMTEAQLADYYYERRGDMSEWKAKPRKIRARRGGPSTVFSIRVTHDELKALSEAAGDGTLTDFIRTAALEKAAFRQKLKRSMRVELTYDDRKIDTEKLAGLFERTLQRYVASGAVDITEIEDRESQAASRT